MTPKNDKVKLLRTGRVRATTPIARGGGRSARYAESDVVQVPDIEECGRGPFTENDLQSLAQRLQDPRWTRGTRNIYGLEGLLTALLVLPLGLRLGAWLPLVWNEGGWKVQTTLGGRENSREFVDLIVGFMRSIDAGLCATPPHFESVVDTLAPRYGVRAPHAQKAWAQGFGLAVSEARYLDIPLDPGVQGSLLAIAMLVNPSSGPRVLAQKSHATLQTSVLALARGRVSRGPLGPLT